MKLRGLVPNSYIHVAVSNLYISRSMNVEIGRQSIIILIGNKEAAQFHFWKYINRNISIGTFILDSHRPIICSVIFLDLLCRTILLGFLCLILFCLNRTLNLFCWTIGIFCLTP
jgi:hypothetical protein